MKALAITTALATLGLLSLPSVHAEDSMSARRENVSIFLVPLQCPAAPHIGCGSSAKPILLALESEIDLAEAWLNGTGTSLAVVGKETSGAESRAKTVTALMESVFGKPSATELRGEARERELKSFLSGHGWYRGAQVDSLSRVEAGIIAARLVRRVQARGITLSDDTARSFEIALAEAFKRRFIREPGQPPPTAGSSYDDLLKAAREHLDEKGVIAFQHSIAKGVRPEPNER